MFNRARFRPRFRGGSSAAPSLALNFLDGSLDPRFTFTRASNAWEFGNTGILTQYASNAPRFGYDQTTLASRGLLMEGEKTNFVLQSYYVAAAGGAWTLFGGTATLSLTQNYSASPDGLTRAARMLCVGPNAGQITLRIPTSGLPVSTDSTVSFWAYTRSLGNATSCVVDIMDGATSVNILPQFTLNEWQRIVVPVLESGTTAGAQWIDVNFAGYTTGNIDIDFWGGQIETDSFPTSLIVTAGSTVTRDVDTALMTPVTPWFNSAEGTMFLEMSFPYFPEGNPGAGIQDLFRLDDGSNSFFMIRMAGRSISATYLDGIVSVSGATVFDGFNYTGFTGNQILKIALAYNATQCATSFNGSVPATAAVASLPSGINRLSLNGTNGAAYFRRIAYYPTRLSDATLRAITS
jgi:hypothetical protein